MRELAGDLSGPCGAQVIKRVKIGTGTRELLYRREASGVAVGSVGAQAGAQDWQRTRERLAWDQEQAWAFTIGSMGQADNVRLGVDMPAELRDGDEYTIELSSARQVWIIALYEESNGNAGILLPNREHPNVVIAAGQRRPLPSMRMSLRDPSVEAREKMVLYAFTAQEDYEDFRAPAGAVAEAEATAYYRALPERLSTLPRKRWGRGETTYLIKPGARP